MVLDIVEGLWFSFDCSCYIVYTNKFKLTHSQIWLRLQYY